MTNSQDNKKCEKCGFWDNGHYADCSTLKDNNKEWEEKLKWLWEVLRDSHHGCVFRQDGIRRKKVNCGGCGHSRETYIRAKEKIVGYILQTQRQRICEELEGVEKEIQASLDYCRQQNGLPHCKNCGLSGELLTKLKKIKDK